MIVKRVRGKYKYFFNIAHKLYRKCISEVLLQMKKIKLGFGAVLMLAVMLISDREDVLLIYIFSALLHETGHLIAAKLLDIEIKEIRFDFSGARICTDSSVISYKKELLLACAGPAANIIAVILICISFAGSHSSLNELWTYASDFIFADSLTVEGVIGFFALCSVLQGAINLLPVRSFDGGRILMCIMAMLFSERTAECVVGIMSAISAFVLWTVALYLMLRISSGLGIYVFAACIFAGILANNSEKTR